MQDVIGINCSKELGKKNFRKFWAKFFIYLYINFGLVFIGIIFVLFSKSFLNFLKLKQNIIKLLSPFLIKLLIAKIIENFNICIESILIAQKIAEIFIFTNIINLSVFIFTSYITIMVYELELNGFIIAFYCKVITELLLLLIILYKYSNINFIKPKFKEIIEDLFSDIKYSFFIIFSVFGSYFSFELLTYFVVLSGKIENINSWCFYMIYFYYLLCSNFGFYATFRTYTSIAIGEKDYNKYKKIWKKVFWAAELFNIFTNTLGYIFSDNIASIFTNDKKTLEITSNLIKACLFIRPLQYGCAHFASSLRVIKLENMQFYIAVFFLSSFSLLFSYLFYCFTDLENYGYALAWFLVVIL